MVPPVKKGSTKRLSLNAFLLASKNDNLSVELRKFVMDPIDVDKYLRELSPIIVPESNTTQSFAKLYHRCTSDRGSCDVKIKTFGSNAIALVNESTRVITLGEVTLTATKVTSIESLPPVADRVELVTRFGFVLKNFPNWGLNIELTRSLSNPLEFATKLPAGKALLVDVPLESMDPSAYDHVTTTLVHIESSPVTRAEIEDVIDDVRSSGDALPSSEKNEYQSVIYLLALDIFRDAVMANEYRQKSGFKRLCSNTVELSRPIYFKKVLPKISEFYMTDKIDGTRAMLVIDEVYRRSGHRRIFLGANIYAVSDRLYEIASFKKPTTTSKTVETDHTVLDVEMITNTDGEPSFFCFDVIAVASRKVGHSPFGTRIKTFDEVGKIMDKYNLGKVKEFIELSGTDYASQITSFYEKKRDYVIDGIIFTPKGSFYKDAKKARRGKFDRIFNTDYANTVSFKWKPLSHLTIDFYLMAHPKKKGSYVLCSGVDMRTFKLLRLRFFDGYVAPVSQNSQRYFPIQFEPSDGEFDNVWTPSKDELVLCEQDSECPALSGIVGEFAFAGSDGELYDRPRMIRLRTDRVQDIAKGEYYGNALRYAELIWHSVRHPLTIKSMSGEDSAGYFASEDYDDGFKAQRNYNSFVKSYLLETYVQPNTTNGDTPSRIMDLACGRGQDIARAIDTGMFDEVVAIDKDVDAIYELLERKYNLRVKRNGASANIYVKQADLGSNSNELVRRLKLPVASADAIMINFALHYFCRSATADGSSPIEEFAKTVAYYAKPGARLMITTFMGEDVFNALKDKEELAIMDNGKLKYSIKKKYASESMTNLDQEIDVLLPFSAGRYYSEYLVNYEYVQSVMKAHGFKVVATDSFETLLRVYKRQNKAGYMTMSKADRQWVSIYGFMIFERE